MAPVSSEDGIIGITQRWKAGIIQRWRAVFPTCEMQLLVNVLISPLHEKLVIHCKTV